jgi:hypothetical protein
MQPSPKPYLEQAQQLDAALQMYISNLSTALQELAAAQRICRARWWRSSNNIPAGALDVPAARAAVLQLLPSLLQPSAVRKHLLPTLPARKVQQPSRTWRQFLQFRSSRSNNLLAAAGAKADNQPGASTAVVAGPSAHQCSSGSNSCSSMAKKPGYLQLLAAARHAIAAATTPQLEDSSAATAAPDNPAVGPERETAVSAATAMLAGTAGAGPATDAFATSCLASSNSSTVACDNSQPQSRVTSQSIARKPQAVESSCSLRLCVPEVHDVTAATVATTQQQARIAALSAQEAMPPVGVGALQLVHALAESQNMLLQLMHGGGMQLLTFGEFQEGGEETAAAVSAGGAGHPAAGGVAAVENSQTSAPAAAAAVGACNRHTAAGPVCEAVKDNCNSIHGAFKAHEWSAPATTSAPGGLTASAGAGMETAWGVKSSGQPHEPCVMLRLSSAGSEACGSAEVDATDAGGVQLHLQEMQHQQQPPQPALQELSSVTHAAQHAAVAASIRVGTAGSPQATRLILGAHAEPAADAVASSVQSCRVTALEEQQRARQQHQQREVLQQLLTDDYLRGWDGEGSQGTQLLPTVAGFRPLACATQVRCRVGASAQHHAVGYRLWVCMYTCLMCCQHWMQVASTCWDVQHATAWLIDFLFSMYMLLAFLLFVQCRDTRSTCGRAISRLACIPGVKGSLFVEGNCTA